MEKLRPIRVEKIEDEGFTKACGICSRDTSHLGALGLSLIPKDAVTIHTTLIPRPKHSQLPTSINLLKFQLIVDCLSIMGGKMIIGSEAGFEYRWRFSRGDVDEFSPYLMSKMKDREKDSEFVSKLKPGYRIFVFEFRTDFIWRPVAGGPNTVMDSERFSCVVFELETVKSDWIMLWCQASGRTRDYWMGHEETKRLVDEAFDFARENAGAHDHWVPVVVDLEVCTAQQEGESIEASMERAIRAQYLMPLSYLTAHLLPTEEYKPKKFDIRHIFSRKMGMVRVEEKNEDEKKACGICSRNTSHVGAVLSTIPACGHTFHAHCLCLWLEATTRCPTCQTAAYHRYELI
ncbi:RING/U-box superfamily protein [Striga asiatica]|uniref:RING-type E3 ubiquitin transferase n=1 Tax=Striga asiatica TaxID=4170 RepID=A0A5A7P0G9_STRAF|nr:RING/U-box superfamily protein [Striga asiatica]